MLAGSSVCSQSIAFVLLVVCFLRILFAGTYFKQFVPESLHDNNTLGEVTSRGEYH